MLPPWLNWIKPCHIDGALFLMISLFTAISGALGTDGAAKHIGDAPLWFCQQVSLICNSVFLALKMYRSTTYAQFRDVENKKMVKKQTDEEAIQTAAVEKAVASIKEETKI